MKKIRVAILGSGIIATDLLIKTLRSPHLECRALIGRRASSPGLLRARELGVPTSIDSLAYLEQNPDCCDLVFDATSAADHVRHAPVLARLGKIAIDLTPAQLGAMCVPAVADVAGGADDIDFAGRFHDASNISMVTCGGQAAAPVAFALGQTHSKIECIEVVSSIAAQSAGPATRANLDEYIHATEKAVLRFSGAARAKAILNLNPAVPCIDMQTTVLARIERPDLERFGRKLSEIVAAVQGYVPGYELLLAPRIENDRVVVMVRVKGRGDHLPSYAGNLDIVNCAAIAAAERFALGRETRRM